MAKGSGGPVPSWKSRALTAERKLRRIRALLNKIDATVIALYMESYFEEYANRIELPPTE